MNWGSFINRLEEAAEMRVEETNRVFELPYEGAGDLVERARIELDAREMVTFTDDRGAELDVYGMDWGYALSSDLRLREHGLRQVTVLSHDGKLVTWLVRPAGWDDMMAYAERWKYRVVGQ